jgi:hypothetical protein
MVKTEPTYFLLEGTEILTAMVTSSACYLHNSSVFIVLFYDPEDGGGM